MRTVHKSKLYCYTTGIVGLFIDGVSLPCSLSFFHCSVFLIYAKLNNYISFVAFFLQLSLCCFSCAVFSSFVRIWGFLTLPFSLTFYLLLTYEHTHTHAKCKKTSCLSRSWNIHQRQISLPFTMEVAIVGKTKIGCTLFGCRQSCIWNWSTMRIEPKCIIHSDTHTHKQIHSSLLLKSFFFHSSSIVMLVNLYLCVKIQANVFGMVFTTSRYASLSDAILCGV